MTEQEITEQQIHSFCKKYKIKNYTINADMSIDVNSDVSFSKQKLSELPLNFKKVSGNFDCSNNRLTSLVGCPKEVGGDFQCSYNRLTSLVFSPIEVEGVFDCSNNRLTSLEGCQFDFLAINFECNDITPNSLFELDDLFYEKALRKFDEMDNYTGGSWYEDYFDITKREFVILKRQYRIGRILA